MIQLENKDRCGVRGRLQDPEKHRGHAQERDTWQQQWHEHPRSNASTKASTARMGFSSLM
jgi:hypothetical protein